MITAGCRCGDSCLVSTMTGSNYFVTTEHKPKILQKEGLRLLCTGLQDGCLSSQGQPFESGRCDDQCCAQCSLM